MTLYICRDLPGGWPGADSYQPRPPRDLGHLLRAQEAEARARRGQGAQRPRRGHRESGDPEKLHRAGA